MELPPFDRYATGIFFLDKVHHQDSEAKFGELAKNLGMSILAWRSVPTDNSSIGTVAKNTEPLMRQVRRNNTLPYHCLSRNWSNLTSERIINFILQVFVAPNNTDINGDELDRNIFILRKQASHQIPGPGKRFYICSLSRKTIVYKGQFTSDQLWSYFTDLSNPLYTAYLALVHTRFSTNTFPSWERAHPLRLIITSF